MILVDSSGWLEFFTDGPYSRDFAHRLREPSNVITPTLVLYEVYKHVKRRRSEEDADKAAEAILNTEIVPLTEQLALSAADLSLQHRLAVADAIVLATARQYEATIYTCDEDFEGLAGVRLFSKKS